MNKKIQNSAHLKSSLILVIGGAVVFLLLGAVLFSYKDKANYYDVPLPLGKNTCYTVTLGSGTLISSDICRYYKPDKEQAGSFSYNGRYYRCEREISGKYFKGTRRGRVLFVFAPNSPDEVKELCTNPSLYQD